MAPKIFSFGLLLLAWSFLASLAEAITTRSTILVFARDSDSAYSATSGLNAYGIPYELILVPQTGITLPSLSSAKDTGNYGGIIILSEVSYDYPTGWTSAITKAQFQTLYTYQTTFGVRMVRLDVYPDSNYGVTTAIPGTGCCDQDVEQLVSFSDVSAFPTAGLKRGATMSTANLLHYPAVITDSSTTKAIAQFSPGGRFNTATTAAVINNFSGRQQLVWFTSWATSWSATSNFLMHAHIHWMTRGLFIGRRRVYFSTQVDDMHLATYLYQPVDGRFRARPSDMDHHVAWQSSLNSRLPAGSTYFVEIGHNGNGNIEWAINDDTQDICSPNSMIQYDAPPNTALEFKKPLGSGTSIWPKNPNSYQWQIGCISLDKLVNWFRIPANRDQFAHVSHTFTHESLNNATYSDVNKEITFNVAWLAQTGMSSGKRFSANSLIPPAITGIHNGDAIKAWLDNGIKYVVGDSSRPLTLSSENEYWPKISTVAADGYAGLTVIPRWASPIYYNCDSADCTLNEWVNTSGGSGNFGNLLEFSKSTYTRHLLALHQDGFMFHQANMRSGDTPSFTVGDQTSAMSLLEIFVETLAQEMVRLTTWPLVSLKQNDLGVQFGNRMALDKCQPNLRYIISNNAITGVTVSANSNTCSVPIPVTLPVTASTPAGSTSEKLGGDPLTIWTKLSGSAVTIQLSTPVAL